MRPRPRGGAQPGSPLIDNMTCTGHLLVMSKTGVADLKARLSEHLRAVRRGDEITVMDRETPIARLVPYATSGALRVREPSGRYGKPSDVPLPPPARVAADVVEALREERKDRL